MKERKSHIFEREAANWYVEPEWVSLRLFHKEAFVGKIVDPCAGQGNILNAAKRYGYSTEGYDLCDRGGEGIRSGVDFFRSQSPGLYPVDNIVSNPPYGRRDPEFLGERARLEEHFLDLALERTRSKVAIFVDASWTNSARRWEWLKDLPLYRIYGVGPRPSCPPGHVLKQGGKASGGRTDYCWLVFLHGYSGPPTFHFIHRDEC